ncbi:MAG: Rap1a/Tai family immunity protein [Nitrososphaeria archaeon]
MVLLIVLVFVIGTAGTLHCEEQEATGNDLLRDCSLAVDMAQENYVSKALSKNKTMPSQSQQNKAMQCLSFVVGFKDALYVSQIYQEKNGITPFICLPENNLNNGQAVRIVLQYLGDNPQLLDNPQSAIVFNAFYYAFPCKK